MRCFIALPVSAEVKAEAAKIQAKITRENPGAVVKWTEPENFHLTLKFLGEISEAEAERVKNILVELAGRHNAFSCGLKRFSGFPNLKQPNVLVIELEGGEKEGRELWQDLDAALTSAGFVFEDEKPWRPHLTLGRVKDGARFSNLEKISVAPVSWTIDNLEFFKSTLTPAGPKYEKIGEWGLKTTGFPPSRE